MPLKPLPLHYDGNDERYNADLESFNKFPERWGVNENFTVDETQPDYIQKVEAEMKLEVHQVVNSTSKVRGPKKGWKKAKQQEV